MCACNSLNWSVCKAPQMARIRAHSLTGSCAYKGQNMIHNLKASLEKCFQGGPTWTGTLISELWCEFQQCRGKGSHLRSCDSQEIELPDGVGLPCDLVWQFDCTISVTEQVSPIWQFDFPNVFLAATLLPLHLNRPPPEWLCHKVVGSRFFKANAITELAMKDLCTIAEPNRRQDNFVKLTVFRCLCYAHDLLSFQMSLETQSYRRCSAIENGKAACRSTTKYEKAACSFKPIIHATTLKLLLLHHSFRCKTNNLKLLCYVSD